MRNRQYRIFAADFETTVYEGQDHTEVWAAALVEINTEDVFVTNSINDLFSLVFDLMKKSNIKLYFHNLKFDGSFILDYFIRQCLFHQAYYLTDPLDPYSAVWHKDKNMQNGDFKYLISDMGQWYMIQLKLHGHMLQIVDSFKLLPFSLSNIGKSFETKHQKTSIEYTGYREAGGVIAPEEQDYIANDVLVLKEALEIMFSEGHDKLTIGACCLQEFRQLTGFYDFGEMYPDLKKCLLDKEIYGSPDADAYIRKAYRGGWCYLVRGKENHVYKNGITLDVNSLYPSVMSGESGNVYPYGNPFFWSGDYIPDQARKKGRYYYIRVRTRFELKPGMLPTLQIKNMSWYARNEYLETSAIRIKGVEYDRATIGDKVIDSRPTLTLTCTDWQLLQEHYYLFDTEILDGCWFFARAGVFDVYIDKYRKIKMESKGAMRTLAKLYLNNLYGKLATGDNSSYKIAYEKEDGSLGFYTIAEAGKKVVYIAAGAAVTAYARAFTIQAAQSNFYGRDKPGFIYADTDSIHCDLPIEKVKGVKLDDVNFLCWKHEASWKRGLFLRQKTYIEETDDGANVTACGMGVRCKELISNCINGTDPEPRNEAEREFCENFTKLEDFRIGLKVPSNLKQKRIPGGVVLMEDEFCIR